jgi:hypothetical protein
MLTLAGSIAAAGLLLESDTVVTPDAGDERATVPVTEDPPTTVPAPSATLTFPTGGLGPGPESLQPHNNVRQAAATTDEVIRR